MKTIFKKVSAAVMALTVMSTAAVVVFNMPETIAAEAETSSAGDCNNGHSGMTGTINASDLSTGGNYYLTDDVTLTSEITIGSGVTVTLCLNGNKIIAAEGSHTRIFKINSGGTLTICDCIGSGTITGGSANKGGGVYIHNGGFFTMKGGTISNNEALYSQEDKDKGTGNGGGVYVDAGGNFIMDGGSLSGNIAGHEGGGVYVCNSGNNYGTFIMNGGTISDNTVEYTVDTDNGGGGVYVAGKFTMYNGKISGNIAGTDPDYCFGGGVCVDPSGEFTLKDGTLSENNAKYGGGVYINQGKFTMESGTIDSNTASSGGGGVCLGSGKAGRFEMTGGKITGNISKNGGGINMTGGTLLLNGIINITSNGKNSLESNIYLVKKDDDNMITIGENFNIVNNNIIGVHASSKPDCTNLVNATQFAGDVSTTKKEDIQQNFASKYFKADTDKGIVYNDDKEKLKLLGDHNPNKVNETTATCTEPGIEEYWRCEVCHNLFKDAECKTEIQTPASIAALGHDYSLWEITKEPTYTEEGEIKYICANDSSHQYTEPLAILTYPKPVPPVNPTNEDSNSSDDSSSGESSNPAESSNPGESSAPAESNTAENSSFGENNGANDAPYTGAEISILPIAACVAAISAVLAKRSKEKDIRK